MLKQVPFGERWLNVMPNRKAVNRTDGVGMPSLSPMCLGPVEHCQPGLPVAQNIENYHQASKVWFSELADTTNPIHAHAFDDINTLPSPNTGWYQKRLEMFNDPEPHRHKFGADQMAEERKKIVNQSNVNQAMYSIQLTLTGEERRFTYVESRYFYCCAYEKLVMVQSDFQQLLDWHHTGVDIRLCGYDGHDMGISSDAETIYQHYCDTTKPFGHERVLYAMIILSNTPQDLPWHRYRREHLSKYIDIAHVK
jgi:hypothetical protein